MAACLQQVASCYFSGENGHLFNLSIAWSDGKLKSHLPARTGPCVFKQEKETVHYNTASEVLIDSAPISMSVSAYILFVLV